MRTILGALIVWAVLLVWILPSVPAQAEEQHGQQGSSAQIGNTEPRDARDDKEATAQDKNTKPSRNLSGLKNASRQQGAPKHKDSKNSRDARDDKEAGSTSHK